FHVTGVQTCALPISGGNSVLAPWVRHQFPEVGRLIAELRDTPCGQAHCGYCSTTHDPRHELKRYFGFDDFRTEPDGRTLQHDVRSEERRVGKERRCR